MDLLERDALLDEMGGVLATAAGGGRVVLVAGEAGIGKSALVKASRGTATIGGVRWFGNHWVLSLLLAVGRWL